MKNEDSTCLVSILVLLVSAVPLVGWAASPRAHPFLGTLGILLYVVGGGVGIYGAFLATEPGETIPETTKTVPSTSGTEHAKLAMRKAAGA